jgi:imidazoleglycerol-phosphate dehydratase
MKLTRETTETRVDVELAVGSGAASVKTSVPFLDHMITTLARYSGLDIGVNAKGDMKHHVVEDVAISMAAAFVAILPETCSRHGNSVVAMDDALVQAVLDAGGRSYYRGPIPSRLYDHWMRSFAANAGVTLHLRVLRGTNRHHIVEASFKALGFTIRQALVENDAVFSTKGAVILRRG